MYIALEGFSEALAKEIEPAWNIKVHNRVLFCGIANSVYINQITLVEPARFRTNIAIGPEVTYPVHPEYANPTLPVAFYRQLFGNPEHELLQDPAKGVKAIYKLAELESPPLRFPLGTNAVARAKEKIASFMGEVEKYESWSQDMAFDKT